MRSLWPDDTMWPKSALVEILDTAVATCWLMLENAVNVGI